MDNRKIGIVAILAFSMFTTFSIVPSVQASTIYVPDDYPTIQSAVDAAYPGDTINVGSGTYKENVIMDKKRTLIGDAFTTIDAQGKGGAINISADHCVVTGFRCVNATKSRCAGIKVESNWNRIENNTCEKNNYGIYLKDSSNNTILNNEILNNEYGIRLYYPRSSTVRVNASEYVAEGATFVATIDVDNVIDLSLALFDLSFDPEVIEVSDISDGRINGEEFLIEMWDLTDKHTMLVFIMAPMWRGVSGSGYLAEIEFKVKGKEGEKSKLNLSNGELSNVMGEELPANWHGAEVTISVEEEEPVPARNIHTGENISLVQDGSHNNLIRNNNISNNQYGIYLVYSSNNTLMNNIVRSNSEEGFSLRHSANNMIVDNEISDNRRDGIYLVDSTNNIITSNEIYNNKVYGIYLRNSGNSTLTNNIISGSDHNFAVYGELLSDYIQNIDVSSKVEGKPVYYLVNKKNQRIPSDAGYVGIVNSTNVTVNDLTLTNNSQGVLLAFSSNSKIENVNVLNNKYGIYMDYSSDNVLMNNKVSNNDDDGIYLKYSTNNDIRDNKIHENKDNGICAYDASNDNTIQNNEIHENKDDGIYLKRSMNTEIMYNEIQENRDNGIFQQYSHSSNISNNNCSSNRDGIHIEDSNNNSISNNNCSNSWSSIYLLDSNNNKLTGNIMLESGIVIGGDSLSDYTHEIDESNMVNGKQVYYWKDMEGEKIPDGAGQVILVNCTNIAIENQNLNNASTGIEAAFSSCISIENNTCSSNNEVGIRLYNSSVNSISKNNCSNNGFSIHLYNSSISSISKNNCSSNKLGIYLSGDSNNNHIYFNNFVNNTANDYSFGRTNVWNYKKKITYTYNETTYTYYLGNYWSDYRGKDTNKDGIGDAPYYIGWWEKDNYPLMESWEKYF